MEPLLDFASVNKAIEQQALSKKLSGLEGKRDDVITWAIADGIARGIPVDEISVIGGGAYARPSADQHRNARSLDVEPMTGNILNNYSRALRADLDAALTNNGAVEVPEVKPVMIGLRRAINDYRLRRTEEKLEGLKPHAAAVAHAGTILLRNKFGEGYYKYVDDGILEAPDAKRDGVVIREIERRREKRHKLLAQKSRFELRPDTSITRPAAETARQRDISKTDKKIARLEQEIHGISYRRPVSHDKLVDRRRRLAGKKIAFDRLSR